MCLGVPGRVVQWINFDPTFAAARIAFGGVTRECSMACVPDAAEGDYVVVHAGIAISRIDAAAARCAIQELAAVGETAPDHNLSSPPSFPQQATSDDEIRG